MNLLCIAHPYLQPASRFLFEFFARGTCRSDGRFCGCDSCCTVRSSSCAGKVDTGRIASAFSSHWHWGPMKSRSASAGVPMRPSRERAPRRQETHPPASLWTAPGDMENSRPLRRHCQAMGSPSHCLANQKPSRLHVPPKLTLDGSLTGSSIPARRRSSAAWARCRPLGESRRTLMRPGPVWHTPCDLCWLAVVWALTPAATIELWASLLALATLATAAAEQVAMYCERALERFRLLLSGALMMPLRFLRVPTPGMSPSSPQQLSCASSSSTARLPSMDPRWQTWAVWGGGRGSWGSFRWTGDRVATFLRSPKPRWDWRVHSWRSRPLERVHTRRASRTSHRSVH